jgi:hypothetical protein
MLSWVLFLRGVLLLVLLFSKEVARAPRYFAITERAGALTLAVGVTLGCLDWSDAASDRWLVRAA